MELLPPGTQAPDFEALDHEGEVVRLAEARGRPVVLFFYPEDETPGCIAEVCGFRDEYPAFRREGVEVWGISTDGVESHGRFAANHNLPFRLLADPDGRIASAFGALRPDGYASRVTYLLTREGRVAEVWPKVTPQTHAAETLAAVARLRAAVPAEG